MQWFDIFIDNKHDFIKYLLDNNVHCRPFWFPITTQKAYFENKKYENSNFVSSRGLWLPSNFNLREVDIQNISNIIKNYFKNEK